MITGVGVDIARLSAFSDEAARERFMARYFASSERDYVNSRGKGAAASAAACFAAKEAFTKALGLGLAACPPADIVVTHDENGAPGYDLKGRAKDLADKAGITRCHLSLSHDEGLAIAFCVLETP